MTVTALVAGFVPAPAANAIRRLQVDIANYNPLLPPHLTLLVPVTAPLDEVADKLASAVEGWSALRLRLGPVGRFHDPEDVVHLSVGGADRGRLDELHDALAAFEPWGAFPFTPHVTIMRGLPLQVLDRCFAEARSFAWDLELTELVVVRLEAVGAGHRWEVGRRVPLTAPAGRG